MNPVQEHELKVRKLLKDYERSKEGKLRTREREKADDLADAFTKQFNDFYYPLCPPTEATLTPPQEGLAKINTDIFLRYDYKDGDTE